MIALFRDVQPHTKAQRREGADHRIDHNCAMCDEVCVNLFLNHRATEGAENKTNHTRLMDAHKGCLCAVGNLSTGNGFTRDL